MNLLKFSKGNAKLNNKIFTLSLPSGWACPFADKCLSKADIKTGTLTDGKNTEFRCFSATQENIFPATRAQRNYNFNLLKKLKSASQVADLILVSIPKGATIIRIHVAGDFFSQTYFDGWMEAAKRRPEIIFYGYTKSIPYLVTRMHEMPENFRLTASKGGRMDSMIAQHNLKYAEVVYSNEQAEGLGLEIDHDDSHAIKNTGSFALIIHGTQPAKSEAGKALQKLKSAGFTGYNRKEKKERESKIKEAA